MLDIYNLVNVLPKLPLVIESLSTYDEFLFIGTKEGHLLMYKYEFKGEYNKEGIEEAVLSLVKSSRNFSRKPVTQLAVIKDFQILISLSDSVISVHDLSASDQGSFPVLETLTRTKGAAMFALNLFKDPSKFKTKVTMCVVVRQRLQIFHLKGDDRKFEEAVNFKLAVPETPKAVVWVNDGLFINVGGEYQKMKLSGDFSKLFFIDRNQDPKIIPLPDGRIAFGLDDKVVFANQDGSIGKEPVKWSGIPGQIAQDAPFLVALFPHHVEIRPYDPPGKDSEAVQRVEIAKAKIICDTQNRGVMFIASANAIWAIRTASTTKLIDHLISAKQFQLAENIAKYSEADELLKGELLQRIRSLYAFQLFCDKEFKKAFDLFYQLGTEPPQVIGLFPDFLPPNARDAMKYPSKIPDLTGSALENAISALIEYLTEWRQKLLLEFSRQDRKSEEDETKYKDLLQIVDTTLLKCYLATNPALVSHLLRLADNHCNFEESERCLRKEKRFHELIILYKSQGLHKSALEFLRKESEKAESPLSGYQRMAEYLKEIAKDELELVFQYARFVIKPSPEEGLQIFINDLHDTEQIPRDKVFEYIKRYGPELVVPYLEHVIHVWGDTTDNFHTVLGEAYITRVSGAIRNQEDPNVIAPLRQKLQTFLGWSEYYVPALLLTQLPLDCMFEERALVLGRMGRFEQAIGLYVHVLKADTQAERFCEQFYDATNPDSAQVFYLLFKTYVKPPEASTLGVLLNDLPTTEKRLEEALRILRKYSGRIDYAKGMELVPKTVAVKELADFLITALQVLTSKRRQVELMKSLHHSEYLQVQNQRIKYEGESFVVTEDDTCEICKRRIGKNTAFIRSPAKTLRHYACGTTGRR